MVRKDWLPALTHLVGLSLTLLLLSACSTTKYVPEGEYLLSRVDIKDAEHTGGVNTAQLRNYLRQKPNASWFSLYKLPLATYSLSGRDTTRWVNRTLRAMGEPPVLFDSLLALRTCADLRQQLRNEGFLRAGVDMTVSSKGRKKKRVSYELHPGKPYAIGRLSYDIADTAIAKVLWGIEGETSTLPGSLLREGMTFNVATLDAERKRLATLLADSGYYRFHKEYITYRADTISPSSRLSPVVPAESREAPQLSAITSPSKIALTLQLAPADHRRYWLRHISYASGNPQDSVIHLRRHVLQECTHIEEGDHYRSSALQNTYNHFGRLQAVKYTNITLLPVEGTDSLDCHIQLQTNKPSTISFQPEGTNTAGDLGAAATLTYQNRNLFRGSEVLSVELRGAYEAIRGLEGYSNQDFLEYSFGAKLQFPRFLMPFVYDELRRRANATSEVSLLYDLQDRPEFHRRLLSATWRYRWSFPNRHDRYQLDLLDLNYVFMPWISDTFSNEYLDDDNSRNAILRYNYEDLFITKIGFGYTWAHGGTALKANIETSGNLLFLGAKTFNSEKDANDHYRVFNIAFAQYAKADLDLSHIFQLNRDNQLVLHAGLGIAYPYGNSTVLPFEKRYFSGGANSVRGWTVRTLGPGRYKERDGRINFINQTGDMKLDLNAELRSDLFWKFSGALFVDAGNIWTLRQYREQPGGQFRFSELLDQLAVSYGLGLRLNFDFFILRFDLGMKAVNPAYETEQEEHFPIVHPRFSRDYAFHFAVGMPF